AVRVGRLVCARRRRAGPLDPLHAEAAGLADPGIVLSLVRPGDYLHRTPARTGAIHSGIRAHHLPARRAGDSGAISSAASAFDGVPVHTARAGMLARV